MLGRSSKKCKVRGRVKNARALVRPNGNLNTGASQPQSTAAVMEMGSDDKGNIAYCPPPDEFDTSKPMLIHLGGSRSDHWNQMLCNQIINSGWFRESMRP